MLTVFFYMTPCSAVEIYQYFDWRRCLHHQNSYPGKRGNRFLRNVGTFLPDNAESRSRRRLQRCRREKHKPKFIKSEQPNILFSATQSSVKLVTGNVPGGKATTVRVDHPPPSKRRCKRKGGAIPPPLGLRGALQGDL
jgi:hypothetical protein